jgi:novobiocin biosynthesis protein NovU/D-mycarose 3-C-methyltransferase
MPNEAPSPQQALADWVRRDAAVPGVAASAADWERDDCRACRSPGVVEFLDLGDMPPANALLRASELSAPEPRYPLSVRLCTRCGMVQLGHVVPAPLLYRSYLFFTSSSQRMSAHFGELMSVNVAKFVRPGGLVVEIGSNDGTALAAMDRSDIRRLGVDPARNVAVMAAARGVPTVSEFFSRPLAAELRRVAGPASLVVACNVMGHVDDLVDFCGGVRQLLSDEGAMVFEVPYLRDLLSGMEYDTIYHEHLSYFAVRPLSVLLARHGLALERVEHFDVHGGTIRCTVVVGERPSPGVTELIETERAQGLNDPATLLEWAGRVHVLRRALFDRLSELARQGKRVIGYGAPAKGAVVLNACNITPDLVSHVVDSTPAKQRLYMPGTRQPVLPTEELERLAPDVLLLLAWNHAAEVVRREAKLLDRGVQCLTPHLRPCP